MHIGHRFQTRRRWAYNITRHRSRGCSAPLEDIGSSGGTGSSSCSRDSGEVLDRWPGQFRTFHGTRQKSTLRQPVQRVGVSMAAPIPSSSRVLPEGCHHRLFSTLVSVPIKPRWTVAPTGKRQAAFSNSIMPSESLGNARQAPLRSPSASTPSLSSTSIRTSAVGPGLADTYPAAQKLPAVCQSVPDKSTSHPASFRRAAISCLAVMAAGKSLGSIRRTV